MPELDMEKLLQDVAEAPASGSVDGQAFSTHKINDLIALDRYLATKKAMSKGKSGIRIMKLSGGSVND